ncbi:hypothetical protein BDY21DRAFT_280795 [Lineolata rhizophorae]|uniref:ferroxidase n=1 Tax=Lineolata rhizophorae TaxID=578093 RepID=A0A6A6P8R3_9PEZI|nr:hypothetical protein BDY21DRAFT_280795 [Lineolata rhizophorae]
MPPPAPEDADKEGNTTPAGEPKAVQPAEISYEEYHELADGFLEELQGKLEEVQERSEGLEVEFAAGVLTIDTQQGTYVINKQPPNKQIWLSSPLTGPKRYDWVVQGESMHEKEGGGVGGWIYLRDGSSLAQLLKKELNINVERDE